MTDMSVDAVLRKCDELLREGKYIEAIMLLTDTMDECIDARLYSARGRHFWLSEQPEEAVADFTRAIELNPKDAKSYFSRGHILSNYLKRENEAISDFEKALALEPDDAEAHRECCVAFLMMLKPERALDHALAALKLEPGEAATHFCVGRSQMDLKRLDDAVKSLARAVELEPANANYWSSLGHAREGLGGKTNLEFAERAFSRSIQLAPDWPDCFYSRGHVRLRLGRAEDAIADLRHALDLDPGEAISALARLRLEEARKL